MSLSFYYSRYIIQLIQSWCHLMIVYSKQCHCKYDILTPYSYDTSLKFWCHLNIEDCVVHRIQQELHEVSDWVILNP
jgi:hypothetical protein